MDAQVAALGVVSFSSTETGEVAPCLNMKINHRMPRSGYFESDDEQIVHIPAHGKVDTEVVFKEPEVALTKGGEYRARASGFWAGVWIHDHSEKDFKLMIDDTMEIGEYESNEIVIQVAGSDGVEL